MPDGFSRALGMSRDGCFGASSLGLRSAALEGRYETRDFRFELSPKVLVCRAMRAGPRSAIEKISVPGPAIDRCTNVRSFMNCRIALIVLAGDVRLALIRHDPRCVDVERGAGAFAVAQQAARGPVHTLRSHRRPQPPPPASRRSRRRDMSRRAVPRHAARIRQVMIDSAVNNNSGK